MQGPKAGQGGSDDREPGGPGGKSGLGGYGDGLSGGGGPGENARQEGPLKRLERAIRGLREVQNWQALLLEDAQVQVSVLLGTESDQPKAHADDEGSPAGGAGDGAV